MAVTPKLRSFALAFALTVAPPPARADAVADWNKLALNTVVQSGEHFRGTLRAMAMVHVAMFETLNFIEGRYTPHFVVASPRLGGASLEAAAAGAAHQVLTELYPTQRAVLDAALTASLNATEYDQAKSTSLITGKSIAAIILAVRAPDRDEPWLLKTANQFRPATPPALNSRQWTQDYNEVKALGSLISAARTPEQTQMGHFWSVTGPVAWNPVVSQLIAAHRLSLTEGARLHALVSMATADVYLAAWDTQRTYDGRQLSRIDSVRPEYPCVPCIATATVAAILESAFGSEKCPEITMTSRAAPGVVRRWTRIRDYADEVAAGQIYGGTSYRTSTKVGQQIGRKIGEYVVLNVFRPVEQ